MIYFDEIENISKVLSPYKKIIVVSGSDEQFIASKIVNQNNCMSMTIPSGEAAKNLDIVKLMWQTFLRFKADRDTLILSVGGGAISDSVGFAASTFMRGTKFASVPTTFLAIADASIGGKRAINFGNCKNIVGSFYKEEFVFIDTHILDSLDKKQFNNGMYEILKLCFLSGTKLDDNIIENAIKIKESIVEQDFYDNKDIRIQLNYGHTLAHALERQLGINHGLAVGVGMDFASFKNEAVFRTQREAYKKYGLLDSVLKVKIDNIDELIDYIAHDKKTIDGKLKFVSLEKIGKHKISSMNMEQLSSNLLEYKRFV